MGNVITVPQTYIVNGIVFTLADVTYLQTIFPVLDTATVLKEVVRDTGSFQKALTSGVILDVVISPDTQTVLLYLSAVGRELLGVTHVTPVQEFPPVVLSPDQIAELQSLFATSDMAVVPKETVRSDQTIQAAIQGGYALINVVTPANPLATLNLSQAGRALLGKS